MGAGRLPVDARVSVTEAAIDSFSLAAYPSSPPAAAAFTVRAARHGGRITR